MCGFVILLPVFGLVLFWLLPWPTAAAIYAVILAVTIWVMRSVRHALKRLWGRSDGE